jgi:type IV secretory pathway VirJ component
MSRPSFFNRLPESVKARVTGLTLLGPSATASFEFHVTEWLVGDDDTRYPVPPEIERSSVPVTCVSATDDADSVCRGIRAPHVQMASVGRGHHFSGEYGQLVDLILEQLKPQPRALVRQAEVTAFEGHTLLAGSVDAGPVAPDNSVRSGASRRRDRKSRDR